jgi:peptidyl-prolyl cis-trans isomerase A (cyclophilin A)
MLRVTKNALFAVLLIASTGFAQSLELAPPTSTEAVITPPPVEVIMATSMGNMTLSLYADKAPQTVQNFLAYVDDGFFDNTIFHRVMPGFVIQGGGFNAQLEKKQTRPPIINEGNNKLANLRGTLSMARTQDPDSATSQFFINLENNPMLDSADYRPGYAVFGEVTEGLPIIDMISRVRTGNMKQYQNVPLDSVFILSVRRKNPLAE